jgi:transposase
MAMGTKRTPLPLWIDSQSVAKSPGHPFYRKLNAILAEHGFDRFVEERCLKYYRPGGRPSLPPTVYFRSILLGYFEGIGSERGIAWKIADSMSLRDFLGLPITTRTPDHSTISRTRRLISLETHQEIFDWVLQVLAKKKLLRGKTLGVDATTLEANAAMRSIVRQVDDLSYNAFLEGLAKASGISNPTREDLARIDRKREKKSSNQDWKNPHDPDAKITKMKDGRTHLAHKAEHAVDMETGAVVAVTVQPADRGDSESLETTLEKAVDSLGAVVDDPEAAAELSDELMRELVADKGYHSNAVLTAQAEAGIRTYISEPNRGRRNWKGKPEARDAVYANRRRIRGDRGKSLLRGRGEKVERQFAHGYETGGMRRTHLRGHSNIEKRLLVHYAGFNLGLLMREVLGTGTPRGLQGRSLAAFWALFVFSWLSDRLRRAFDRLQIAIRVILAKRPRSVAPVPSDLSKLGALRYATGC